MTANRFTEHPHHVGESYWQHLRAAMTYSGRMLWGAGCCAVHGLCPWLCTTKGSEAIQALHAEMQARQALAQASMHSEVGAAQSSHAEQALGHSG